MAPIFPKHIPPTHAVDGAALEERLRSKGLDDHHLKKVLEAMREEGVIRDPGRRLHAADVDAMARQAQKRTLMLSVIVMVLAAGLGIIGYLFMFKLVE